MLLVWLFFLWCWQDDSAGTFEGCFSYKTSCYWQYNGSGAIITNLYNGSISSGPSRSKCERGG
ncbi:hypothetical protein PR003_g11158 [Phytophthora rubi]|uniref:Pectate lyase n=1 Tax=Phytophthora rubi TaxID=129364 RepID=A0A6A3KV39_9STRA|nr:hypothetical protein PR001_g16071 [Phytophthora rubi]KAE9028433.1 hypothetical protein PR002_g10398 [Phytophthora rubi]KAE9339137.1 hypothetical protein PR003_g11158 [Phytophthora rubi]